MYQFVDTTEPSMAEELPAEAMKINGEYIEDLIDGYRTLYVSGRESLLSEINAYETGVRDGTGITSRRFPARELVIGYLLKAGSNEAFREDYNKLNGLLNVQDAQIIFRDEEDKYFTGTPEGLEEIEPGRNNITGEIIIYCADPFKYSIEEKEETFTSNSFSFDYAGTYKAYPTLEADFRADCGYASWFNQNSKLIQIGDANEEEGENYTASERLIYQNFSTDSSLSSWDANYDSVWVSPGDSSYGLGGSLHNTSWGGSSCLAWNTFIDSPGGWTGSSVSRKIPEDSNNDAGATNWKVEWSMILSNGDGGGANTQRGGIQILVTNFSDQLVAGVSMYKGSSDSGTTGNITLYTASQSSTKTGIDYSRNNSRFGSAGTCTMTKSGSSVSFNLGGLSYSLTDSSITNTEAARVTIVFLSLSDYSHMIAGIYYISFYKNNVTKWRDVTNKFGNGDTAIANCSDGTIFVNGLEDASYGIVGNNWETFYLEPGTNRINFNYSSWCTSAPTSKIRYREVFI